MVTPARKNSWSRLFGVMIKNKSNQMITPGPSDHKWEHVAIRSTNQSPVNPGDIPNIVGHCIVNSFIYK